MSAMILQTSSALGGTSRRQMLRAAATVAVTAAVPFRARAVDPMTVLQAGAAVVSIISGIAGMASDASLRQGIGQILPGSTRSLPTRC